MKKGRRGQGCEGDAAGVDAQRRELLRMALAGSVMGGLGLQASVGQAQFPPAATGGDTVFADGFEPRGPAPGTPLATLRLLSASAQTAPWTAMQAFRKGDVPAGFSVIVSGAQAQATIKNSWPDGSAKLVILAGTAVLGVGETLLTLAAGAAATGPVLSTAALMAAMTQPVVFSAGAFGTASFSGADWSAPFQTWVSGPRMSSWIYRKPIGADAHLVAWLEVRLYADGAVEVLPWIENGYLRVPGPTNKNAVYTFTMGGSQRFSGAIDLKHHQRTPLINGTALSYWLGNDPGVVPLADPTYLQRTELVPTYRARVAETAAVMQAQTASFAPLQQGRFVYGNDDMQSGGYQEPIGLLPEHDVLYLTAESAARPLAYGSVVRNGYSAGRYGIHYRDEATHRMLRFSQQARRNIGDSQGFRDNGSGGGIPLATGGNPPIWDTAHSPSVGYMAYLLTGRFYFMEEAQFAACTNFLGHSSDSWGRNGTQGLVQTAVGAWQTRAMGWQWRTLAQALAVTPDDDATQRSEFLASVENSINALHATYVAQANNPYGFILPGETGDNGTLNDIKVWQQDFVTAAFGYSMTLGLPLSAAVGTRLTEFFEWKARSIVFRFGTAAQFWYVNANRYSVKLGGAPYSASAFLSGTGPWPASAAAIYANTLAAVDGGNEPSTTEGVLAIEYATAASTARGNWGTLQMAIAYAVRHAVPGALDGYKRMLRASNWNSMLVTQWSAATPVMSVAPASGTEPAWLTAAAPAVLEAVPVPGTVWPYGTGIIDAWGVLVQVDGTGLLYSSANGGHSDSADNGVYSVDVEQHAPAWSQRIAATPPGSLIANAAYMADGKPVSRHGYQHGFYIAQRQRVMLFGARGRWSDGNDRYAVDAHSIGPAHVWDGVVPGAPGVSGSGYPDVRPGFFGIAHDPLTGNVWTAGGDLWVQATNTFIDPPGYSGTLRWGWQFDSLRGRFAGFQTNDGQGFGSDPFRGQIMDRSTGVATPITWATDSETTAAIAEINAANAGVGNPAAISNYCCSCYDSGNDCFWLYFGHTSSGSPLTRRFYRITPRTGATGWTLQRVTATGVLPGTPASGSGINGRLRYVASLGGLVLMPTEASGLYFVRTL